jgi:hypothetical protein
MALVQRLCRQISVVFVNLSIYISPSMSNKSGFPRNLLIEVKAGKLTPGWQVSMRRSQNIFM